MKLFDDFDDFEDEGFLDDDSFEDAYDDDFEMEELAENDLESEDEQLNDESYEDKFTIREKVILGGSMGYAFEEGLRERKWKKRKKLRDVDSD